MSTVVVVGAGLTGLVTAERLARSRRPVVVVEREHEVGGACRSTERDGFVFDRTGHLLHTRSARAESYLRELGVWERLAVHERRSAVVVGGRTTPYPVQIHTAALAPEVRRDCLLGFIRAWAARSADEPSSFAEWVLGRFGEGLARHFFFPYNAKLFRLPPAELSVDWVGRFVPRPSLEQVVDGALGLEHGGVGYNATFRYPRRGGIRLLPNAVAERVDEIRLGDEVVCCNPDERWVELASGERLAYSRLVVTVALPELLELLVDPLPAEVAAARSRLRWVRVLNLALGVEGPAPRPEHWLYFPDPELEFYRVGFPSNHGQLAPPGCHTVSVEVSLDPGGADVAELAAETERTAVAAGLVEPVRVVQREVTLVDPAYVVFDHARAEALAVIGRFLLERGLVVAGRWAEWKYSAMEDAILDGIAVAERLETAGR